MNDPDEPATWTDEYAMAHLTATFQQACRSYPDVMEPYLIRLEGAADQKEAMRAALRETVKQRYLVAKIVSESQRLELP